MAIMRMPTEAFICSPAGDFHQSAKKERGGPDDGDGEGSLPLEVGASSIAMVCSHARAGYRFAELVYGGVPQGYAYADDVQLTPRGRQGETFLRMRTIHEIDNDPNDGDGFTSTTYENQCTRYGGSGFPALFTSTYANSGTIHPTQSPLYLYALTGFGYTPSIVTDTASTVEYVTEYDDTGDPGTATITGRERIIFDQPYTHAAYMADAAAIYAAHVSAWESSGTASVAYVYDSTANDSATFATTFDGSPVSSSPCFMAATSTDDPDDYLPGPIHFIQIRHYRLLLSSSPSIPTLSVKYTRRQVNHDADGSSLFTYTRLDPSECGLIGARINLPPEGTSIFHEANIRQPILCSSQRYYD